MREVLVRREIVMFMFAQVREKLVCASERYWYVVRNEETIRSGFGDVGLE